MGESASPKKKEREQRSAEGSVGRSVLFSHDAAACAAPHGIGCYDCVHDTYMHCFQVFAMSSKVGRCPGIQAMDSTSLSHSWPAGQTHTNRSSRPVSSCWAYPSASQIPCWSSSRCASLATTNRHTTTTNVLSPIDVTTSTIGGNGTNANSSSIYDGGAIPCGRHGTPNASPARAGCNATTSRARHGDSCLAANAANAGKGQLQCRHGGAGLWSGQWYPWSACCNSIVGLQPANSNAKTSSRCPANTTTSTMYT